ncbi:hypothetical protein LXT21_30955 [Myxococcus sp. K38C18041901]|uniref:hypothetical protein n=1 Tax=Myxococcus guangdongensis TaxID=2906760 RepID=UPI0020A6FE85|nr:hypothetical protein [Myxococcus guangdongensis]MCP3063205.1 hypothetical protein [Myxococcus guangdongensis]
MRAIWMGILALSLTACGGVESGEALDVENSSQERSALGPPCEGYVGKTCRPGPLEILCTWSDGAEGNCYCQSPPFNKWVCDYSG